jgi:hypothetical protein
MSVAHPLSTGNASNYPYYLTHCVQMISFIEHSIYQKYLFYCNLLHNLNWIWMFELKFQNVVPFFQNNLLCCIIFFSQIKLLSFNV